MTRLEQRRRQTLNRALIGFLRSQGWLQNRRPGESELLEALLAQLAASPAEVVLLNLEDLWAESMPQNVPGTSTERVNWRRKTRLALEQILQSPALASVLGQLNKLRHGKIRYG
jgi:4-alpha-glucanotransferase